MIILKIPIESLIKSIRHYIKENPVYQKLKPQESTKGRPIKVKLGLVQIDSSLCLLLYTYLVHTYDYYETKEYIENFRSANLIIIWKNIYKLIKYFIH